MDLLHCPCREQTCCNYGQGLRINPVTHRPKLTVSRVFVTHTCIRGGISRGPFQAQAAWDSVNYLILPVPAIPMLFILSIKSPSSPKALITEESVLTLNF